MANLASFWNNIQSDLVMFDYDPKDSNRNLTTLEEANHDRATALFEAVYRYMAARDNLNLDNDYDVLEPEVEKFLSKRFYTLSAKNATTVKHTNVQKVSTTSCVHGPSCPSGKEYRLLLLVGECQTISIVTEAEISAAANILDEFINQADFSSNRDCCKIKSIRSDAKDQVGKFLFHLGKLPPETKSKIVTRMKSTSDVAVKCKDDLNQAVVDLLKQSQGHNSASSSGNTQAIQSKPDFPSSADSFSGGNINLIVNYARSLLQMGCSLEVADWPSTVLSAIDMTYSFTNSEFGVKRDKWRSFLDKDILHFLEKSLPENASNELKSPVTIVQDVLQKNPLQFNLKGNMAAEQEKLLRKASEISRVITEVESSATGLTSSEKQLLIKLMGTTPQLHNMNPNQVKAFQAELKDKLRSETNLIEALFIVMESIKDIQTIISKAAVLLSGGSDRYQESSSGSYSQPYKQSTSLISKKRSNHQQSSDSSYPHTGSSSSNQSSNSSSRIKQSQPQKRDIPKRICKGCGFDMKERDGKAVCPRNNLQGCGSDARRNTTDSSWADSLTGKTWAGFGYKALPKDTDINVGNAQEKRNSYVPANKKPKGNHSYMISQCTDQLLTNELISFSILPNQEIAMIDGTRTGSEPLEQVGGKLLLDSGAIGSSVVSESFFRQLIENSLISCKVRTVSHDLNTAIMNHNTLSNKEISFNIYLTSERSATTSTLIVPIRAIVAPIGVDLIVDKYTIKRNSMVQHFPSHFAEGQLLDWLLESEANTPLRAKKNKLPRNHIKAFKCNATMLHNVWVSNQSTSKLVQKQLYADTTTPISYLATIVTKQPQIEEADADFASFLANMTSNFSTKPAYEREGNLSGIPDNKLESIPAELLSDKLDSNEYTRVRVEGSPLVQQELKKLIAEFSDIFKATVQDVPAKLTPFKLEVDTEKWHKPANQLRCRRLDRERERELDSLVKILIDHKIIEACDSAYYSHAFLVPKPNGKWRLVLDFKNLNGATVNCYKWPLPDIKEMLHRVGDSRPEFFAVFDLTSGYYQAEIDEDSRDFTAFLTKHGIFRWLRLPMGLTGACSYFQKALVSEVLKELIHIGCELYLDDCMIHAPTLDSFLKRLRQVFLRFRDSGLTLNPDKCKIGLASVEYVGHTIDKDGLHFTRDKLDSVLNFPRPHTKRQIKSFIGLANYFRDHIKNHSIRVQPLQNLVNKYDKKQARHRVVWDAECVAAFEDIRTAIDECPMLWFLDDFSPIFLQTDASDYGIGAYLYQVVTLDDGSTIERPVGFISKSLGSAHLSWDTPMKEGFGIFYALQKWEYLLRDRQFSILTDHKNLTRLRMDHDSNKMVKRWFMCYQEYDILAWLYVEGENNFVPDTFSRLCKQEEDTHPAIHLFQLTGYEIPSKQWDLIARYHNSKERGHGGLSRTLLLLDEDGHQWKHRTKHVRRFIRMCPCCQKMTQMKSVIHSYPFTLSTYGLWHTVSVDFIERLVPDKYGNNMLIVIVDNFSRFTDLYPCNSTGAEGAADALLAFCGRYVTPMHFTTDCGANFTSALIAALMERLGSDHHLTTAYSKEQNAIVERMNKEVLRHLRNIIFDNRVADKWSKYTPLVQRIINTTKHSATGLTPAEIVFPNGIQLDKSLLTESSSIYVSSYIQDLQLAQSRIIALAELSLRQKDEAHMENYSKERTVFDVGSYVLAEHRHNALRRGPKSKLLPFLKGPMLVKSHNTEGIYVLQDLVSAEVHNYHMSLLRPFLWDERTLTPLQAAVADSLDEFVAEKVLRMRGNTRGKRTDLQFLIRWAGYGEADDTWEPWEYCKDSEAVQRFLREHPERRMQKLAKPIVAEDPMEVVAESDTDEES